MGFFNALFGNNDNYLKCPKCNSAECEIVNMGTKTKFDLGKSIRTHCTYNTSKYNVLKRHCKKCGYMW